MQTIAVFGFCSNNVNQLRTRVNAPELVGLPAVVESYERCFGGPNSSWSVGGRLGGADAKVSTASLRGCPGAHVYGQIVLLTAEQLALLDTYESVAARVYEHTLVTATAHSDGLVSSPFPAIAYARVDHSQYVSGGPTEAYLCAIKRNLQEGFPTDDVTVTIKDGAGAVRADEWRHPGFRALALPAFLYEVGVRKSLPWEMPVTITETVEKLESIGIAPTTPPATIWAEIEAVNARLEAAGKKQLGGDVVAIGQRLLATEGYCIQ